MKNKYYVIFDKEDEQYYLMQDIPDEKDVIIFETDSLLKAELKLTELLN